MRYCMNTLDRYLNHRNLVWEKFFFYGIGCYNHKFTCVLQFSLKISLWYKWFLNWTFLSEIKAHKYNVYFLVSISVTVIVATLPENVSVFHMDSPSAMDVATASIGVVAGVLYILLSAYGFYMAAKLFSFPSDVLKNKLWCFNVLNGLSVIASLMLFGASSFLAKSSACWYDDSPGSAAASSVLTMALIMTVVACFEICVGASGVFVK